jgi:threonine synthase
MKKQRIIGLECGHCGKRLPLNGENQSICPFCGPDRGSLECIFDYDLIRKNLAEHPLKNRRDMSMFRYHELLPVLNKDTHVPLQIGWTPLYDCPDAAERIGVSRIIVKDDSFNPTLSYKDRASAMAVSRARELGYRAVCTASTGNAAASLAACCRSVRLPCAVIVPQTVSRSKLFQMHAYGATVILVDGTYDETLNLAQDASTTFGWMNRSAGFNPYLVEGKKTGALEMGEQTGFNLPDCVFVPVGDGSIISGICKGFEELRQLELTDKCPVVIGVQAEGANALVRAWRFFNETGIIKIEKHAHAGTIAGSISVAFPREGYRALKAVQSTGGFFMDVSEDEIINAMRRLPIETAVMGEPAAAAAYAGLIKARSEDMLPDSLYAAVFVTGNGLKDTQTAQKIWDTGINKPIKPDARALDIIHDRVTQYEKRQS